MAKQCACKLKQKRARVGAAKDSGMGGWLIAAGLGIGAFLVFNSFKNRNGNNTTTNNTTTPNQPTTQLPTTTTTQPPPTNPSTWTQEQTALSTANSATVSAAQTKMNTLFDYFRATGAKPQMWWSSTTTGIPAVLPANLSVDGVYGSMTRSAIKHIFAWGYNLTHTDKKTPNDVSDSIANNTSLVALNTYIAGIVQASS